MGKADPKPRFFRTGADFRKWLEKNHATKDELFVGYYKTSSGKKSITWPESVDEALCFGWIDGRRNTIDDESYTNRFTPRRANSNWSLKNINRVKELKKEGRMHPAGIKAFEARKEERSGVYSFEQRESAKLDETYKRRFRRNLKAWKFFESCAPSYKKTAIFWVMSAKREETRERRFKTLLECSAAGKKVPPLS